MKIVKLNGRHKMLRDHGHVVALRFTEFNHNASEIVRVCQEKFRTSSWDTQGLWHGRYGHRPDAWSSRPYWITFRNKADLTLVLLCAGLTQNS